MARSAALLLTGLLGSASIAGAQESVLLRLAPPAGQLQSVKVSLDIWLFMPGLADSSAPTARVRLHLTRASLPGETVLVVTDRVDSSVVESPGLASAGLMTLPGGDLLRGLALQSRLDPRGLTVASTVVESPRLGGPLPPLLRGLTVLIAAMPRLTVASLPEPEVGAGAQWSDSLRFDMAVAPGVASPVQRNTGTAAARYRLEALEQRDARRLARISVAADLRAAATDPGLATSLLGTLTGSLDVDVATGMLLGSSSELRGLMGSTLGTFPVRVRLAVNGN